MKTSPEIQAELHSIESRDGLLRPESVVEYASNPNTALHSCFTWDDTEAAREHRIWQARQVIRVVIKQMPRMDEEPMRVYVSLKSDRNEEGGGYRTLVSVMSDAERRQELLSQAMEEAKEWRRKYRMLTELAAVFEELDKVQAVAA